MEAKGLQKRITGMTRDDLEDTLLRYHDDNAALKTQFHASENKAKL